MLCEMNRLLINTLDTHVIYLSFLQGSPEKSTFTNLSFINWNGGYPHSCSILLQYHAGTKDNLYWNCCQIKCHNQSHLYAEPSSFVRHYRS